jgi:putative ABC transport system permease protein
MLKNYLKSALRFLKHNKVFALINALSLSIALAVTFIITLYVVNEYSYDRCHANFKRIFRVLNYYVDYKKSYTGTPYVLASALKAEYPQVEKSISVISASGLRIKVEDKDFTVSDAVLTNSDVFDIFTLPIVKRVEQGDLLEDKNSIVISQELAGKIFLGQDPIGKGISVSLSDGDRLFLVKGVFRDIPLNSTFKAQCIFSSKLIIEGLNKSYSVTNADKNWTINSVVTWVLLSKNSNAKELEKQFQTFELKNLGQNSHYHYLLQNLAKVYLGSENVGNTRIKGNTKNIRLFITIALLIILVASTNYVILSTSVSSERMKEIGLRKTFGANNLSIEYQLYTESIIMAIAVMPISILIMWSALPTASKLFGTPIQIIPSNILVYIFISLALTLFIGMLSGIYTSTILFRLEITNILKNSIQIGKKKTLLRSSLIVFQIIIFCSFVSSVLIIRSQYQYAIKRDPGHYNSNVIILNLGRNFSGYSALLNDLKASTNVIMAAGCAECLPMQNSATGMFQHFQDKEVRVQVEAMFVDFNFLETLGIKLVEGRSFSKEFGSDLTQSVILNETAVQKLGIVNPVGQKFAGMTIIGVVKDFNYHSIHTEIPPAYIQLNDEYIWQLVVHYSPGSLKNVRQMLELEWKKFGAGKPISYETIEDLITNIYLSENKLSILVAIYAIIAILIAASGLFGLTLFIARNRTKEIGIKKVFGCSEKSIIYSFLLENFVLVLIAASISIPITLYFMTNWLKNFAYKININWWAFVIPFLIALIIVQLTVFLYSYKVTRINPINTLRYE